MEGIREIDRFHNRYHVFADRYEAGEILGSMLKEEYGGRHDLITLAIPSGGIPVGKKISETLESPFDLVNVRKLQIPGNTESGFGAMTHDGTVLLNEGIVRNLELTPERIARETRQVQIELDRRNKLFRGDTPFPDLKGREVIIADDGLASGYTMLASIHMVHKAGAKRIIVAVPTAHPGSIDKIRPRVNEVYCANIREGRYFAVAEAYKKWYDLSDDEVFGLLEKSSH